MMELLPLLDSLARSGLLALAFVMVAVVHQTARIIKLERAVFRCEERDRKREKRSAAAISRLYYLCEAFAGSRKTGLPPLAVLLGDEDPPDEPDAAADGSRGADGLH